MDLFGNFFESEFSVLNDLFKKKEIAYFSIFNLNFLLFLGTLTMGKFILPRKNPNDIYPSIKAEVKMALMIVLHNTFFRFSDHLTPFIHTEFKGSRAAEIFSCRQAKTAAIVNCVSDHY